MIMHPEVIGVLKFEDLQRWRTWWARDDAIKAAPSLYNRDELEEHFRNGLVMEADFIERYGLTNSPLLRFSATTGDIYYQTPV